MHCSHCRSHINGFRKSTWCVDYPYLVLPSPLTSHEDTPFEHSMRLTVDGEHKASITFIIKLKDIQTLIDDTIREASNQNEPSAIGRVADEAVNVGSQVVQGITTVAEYKSWPDNLDNFETFVDFVDRLAEVCGLSFRLVLSTDNPGQVHPYAKALGHSFGSLQSTSLYTDYASFDLIEPGQLLKAQEDRNNAIAELATTLADVWKLVKDAGPIENQSQRQAQVLTCITQQTVECAYFIRHYALNSGKIIFGVLQPYNR